MSLQDVRVKLETGLNDIYTALEEKSATIPEQKNLINVAPAIRSITGGGGDNSGEYVWSKYSDYVKANENIKLLLPFDGNTIDVTGNNIATVIGNNTYGNGKYGKAKYFNGTDYISIPYTNETNISTGDFTLAFWVKGPYTTLNANTVFFGDGKVDYTVNKTYGMRIGIWPDGKLFVNACTDSNGTSLEIIPSGTFTINKTEWIHLALVRKGNIISTYLNGELINSIEYTGSFYNENVMYIGGRIRQDGELDSPLIGYIDDFVLAKEALYDGNFTPTKILYEDTGKFEEYVVSDNENAYPNNDYGEDGFYYIKGSVENTEATITMLEYIEATGTQYIDTGFIPNQNTSVEMKFKAINNSGTEYFHKWVFGCRTLDVSDSYGFFVDKLEVGNIMMSYSVASAFVETGIDLSKVRTVKLEKNKCYIDGVEALVHDENTFNGRYPITICAFKKSNTVDERMFVGEIYYCKIWDNGTLVRDFIPVLLNGEACLYDKMSKYYFTNAGAGSFNAGPIV